MSFKTVLSVEQLFVQSVGATRAYEVGRAKHTGQEGLSSRVQCKKGLHLLVWWQEGTPHRACLGHGQLDWKRPNTLSLYVKQMKPLQNCLTNQHAMVCVSEWSYVWPLIEQKDWNNVNLNLIYFC